MTTMLDYALAYARRGWKVFPLAVRNKVPLISKEKGGKGCLDATTDREQIFKWWSANPSANIGIATGHSFFVLDIDPKNNGNLWLDTVEVPDTICQQTGSGGTHYIFSGPPDIPNSSSKIAPGVDIRGSGGYIVAPPSIHPNGKPYTWIDCEGIPLDEPTLSPVWLLNEAGKTKTQGVPTIGDVITKGNQHDTLWKYACSLWGGKVKYTEAEIVAAVLVLSKRCEEIPPQQNVEKIVYSVTRKHPQGLSDEYAAKAQKNGHHAEVPAALAEPAAEPEEKDEPDERPLNYIPWPAPLSDLAFHGPLGNLCKIIEPNTESDISAVLFQSLVMIGNVFGRGVHWMAEATPHFCNEFVGIVGVTAKGRKGSSFGQVRGVLGGMDHNWNKFRIKSGLSSGEGLIFHIRDEIREIKQVKGQMVEVVTDAGEADKRMLVVEEELSSAIKSMAREGNTLSGVLRQAWDSPLVLAPMTKNNRITASHPHVSIIGHITRDELLKSLKAVENTNGGTNRFLWCCARRSRLLPRGGRTSGEAVAAVAAEIDAAIGWAQTVKCEIDFDAEAGEMWDIVYEELGNIPAGPIGAILSRAEAHVRRVATIYAALDRSTLIRPEHLEAALEVWRYSADSVKWIFGTVPSEEDKKQDKILAAIADTGVNRREITKATGGHIKRDELDFHLSHLLSSGTIRCASEKRTAKTCDYYYPV